MKGPALAYNRVEQSPDLVAQLAKIREVLDALTEHVTGALAPASLATASHRVTLARLRRERDLRLAFFPADLVGDAEWAVVLAVGERSLANRQESVSSACYAAAPVPPTTALRAIGRLVEARLIERSHDRKDRRRAHLSLTDQGRAALHSYIEKIAPSCGRDVA